MHSFDQALTEAELSELEGYLGSEALPEACMDLEMLDGFLAAVVVGPDPIAPGEWLPWRWGSSMSADEELEFGTGARASGSCSWSRATTTHRHRASGSARVVCPAVL